MSQSIAPWFLWGGTKTLTMTNPFPVSADGVIGPTEQIAQVQGDFPTVWRFLFVAKLQPLPVPQPGIVVTVQFNLRVGISRDHVEIPRFAKLELDPIDNVKALTIAPQPLLFSIDTVAPLIDQFPAESIYLFATLDSGPLQGNQVVSVDVSALFAPVSHVRPEWYAGKFPGLAGTALR
jgi:hypothetical protein